MSANHPLPTCLAHGRLDVVGLIRHDIDHDVGWRPPGSLREDIGHPLEVLW